MQRTAERTPVHSPEKIKQYPSYLDEWDTLAAQNPSDAHRYRQNSEKLKNARRLLREPGLMNQGERQRISAVDRYYFGLAQDSRLEGAGEDLEQALRLIIGKDIVQPESMSVERKQRAIAICDDLQMLDDEVNARTYNQTGIHLCNSILSEEDRSWSDLDKMSAAMMWENFKFEELRRRETYGEEVFSDMESAMSRSLARFSRSTAEIFAMPENTHAEKEARKERLGIAYEWAMTILWRQEQIATDDYGHTAVRNSNIRQDRGHDGATKDSMRSGNLDTVKIHYDDQGEEKLREFFQLKMGNTSKRKYRKPIKKVTLKGMHVGEVVDAVRGIAKLYAPLMKDVPDWARQNFTVADSEKVDNALSAVRVEEAS